MTLDLAQQYAGKTLYIPKWEVVGCAEKGDATGHVEVKFPFAILRRRGNGFVNSGRTGERGGWVLRVRHVALTCAWCVKYACSAGRESLGASF